MVGLEINIDIARGKREEFLQMAETLLEERPGRRHPTLQNRVEMDDE